jgi:hypothetical protein
MSEDELLAGLMRRMIFDAAREGWLAIDEDPYSFGIESTGLSLSDEEKNLILRLRDEAEKVPYKLTIRNGVEIWNEPRAADT